MLLRLTTCRSSTPSTATADISRQHTDRDDRNRYRHIANASTATRKRTPISSDAEGVTLARITSADEKVADIAPKPREEIANNAEQICAARVDQTLRIIPHIRVAVPS